MASRLQYVHIFGETLKLQIINNHENKASDSLKEKRKKESDKFKQYWAKLNFLIQIILTTGPLQFAPHFRPPPAIYAQQATIIIIIIYLLFKQTKSSSTAKPARVFKNFLSPPI